MIFLYNYCDSHQQVRGYDPWRVLTDTYALFSFFRQLYRQKRVILLVKMFFLELGFLPVWGINSNTGFLSYEIKHHGIYSNFVQLPRKSGVKSAVNSQYQAGEADPQPIEDNYCKNTHIGVMHNNIANI
jgi:hypothetical protein